MNNKKILVIEDDGDVRVEYQVLLKSKGYSTIFAPDALFAVSEARRHQPDLIILDLGLPAGEGFLVLERFRAHPSLASIPVIAVSTPDLHANRELALEAGAKAFVQRPLKDSELLAIIGQLLGPAETPVSRP